MIRSRAARCRTCCRRRRPNSARGRRSNSATGRSATPSWQAMVEIAASAFLRAGYGKGTFGRAVPRQHAGSSGQFLRRAEGRRPHRASVAARRRDRAVAQALRLRRARAGHQQSVGAAADGAEIPRQGPARPSDRLRGRRLGQGRHAADRAAGQSGDRHLQAVRRGRDERRQHGPRSRRRRRAAAIYRRHHRPAEGRDAQPRQSDLGGLDLRRLGQAGARRARCDRARDLRAAAVPHLRADGGAAVVDPARQSDLAAPALRRRGRDARHRGQARHLVPRRADDVDRDRLAARSRQARPVLAGLLRLGRRAAAGRGRAGSSSARSA